MKSKPTPSQSELRRLFDYDEPSGALIWRRRPESDFSNKRSCSIFNRRDAEKPAGGSDGHGYISVRINYQIYQAHRIVWCWHNGEIPFGLQIDHIDGNRNNNRIENLRLATGAENSRNCKLRSDNTSGITGVTWDKCREKWVARPSFSGRSYHLGRFRDLSDAASVVANFYRQNGFSDRHAGTTTVHSVTAVRAFGDVPEGMVSVSVDFVNQIKDKEVA